MNKVIAVIAWKKLQRAIGSTGVPVPLVERLEDRWLMAGNPAAVQNVPFTLAFDGNGGGLTDANGVATGFTWVQPNVNGNEYQPNLLNDNTSGGTLSITTTGTAAAGSNWEGDNSQVDVMQSQFDGTSGSFTISTRLIDAGNLANPNEQGGLILGPDDDDYVKFVAVSTTTGQELQFVDEQKTATGYLHAINPADSYTSIGSFSNVNTLDLEIAADADTGTVTGYYRVNGGSLTQVGQSVTLTGAEKTAFFNTTTRAGIMALAKNDLAPVTVTFQNFSVVSGMPAPTLPTVVSASPGSGQTNVSRDAFVSCNLNLPFVGEGVDPNTLNHTTCYLVRTADNKLVPAVLNTDGAGGTIILQPDSPLDANTNYTFYVNAGVKDTGGHSFVPFTTSFTTGTKIVATNPAIAFQKVALPTATGQVYTGVTMGPDGMLYACTYTGLIQRFPINADGTLGTPQDITTVQTNNGGNRTITGMAFDPSSTADNLILWINNSYYAPDIAGDTNAPNFSSKISVLSGANLQNYQDVITGLPRSVRDHMSEEPTFGPDGALYWSQPSNSSMGAPDTQWGLRSETLLTAAILRLNTQTALAMVAANGDQPINVITPDGGGSYNPFASGAPLTIYATGVRNAFSLVWANNGKLYAPVNGASYGGATPSSPNSTPVLAPYKANPAKVQGIADVTAVENDVLDEIQPGAYYGHPDPVRGQYVLDAGNPTTIPASLANAQEFSQYPLGTNADPGYEAPIYNFGNHYSPDGMIQYQGSAFGGALDNALMVTRYSGGKDIEIMFLNSSGGIASVQTGTAGLTGFNSPLGMVEDDATGDLYVADYGAETLTLERPIVPGAEAAVSTRSMYFQAAPGGSASATQTLTLTNNGTQPLAVPADGLVIAGAGATQYLLVNDPPVPTTIAPGESLEIEIAYLPPAGTAAGLYPAAVQIKTNDPANELITIDLFGLATSVPTTPLPAPTGITAIPAPSGVMVSWSAETAGNLAGYNVYSSTSEAGPFTQLNTGGVLPAADDSFVDTTAPSGGTVYYQVTAVDTSDNQSLPGSASVNLSNAVVAPAGLSAVASSSGIALAWGAEAAAAGYNVYRSTSSAGGFALLNSDGLLTAADYDDKKAAVGVTYYYEVTAVDSDGNESAAATASATVPSPIAPPVEPTGFTASAMTGGGISLNWNANTESDLAGYNLYRSMSASGTFALMNTGGLLKQTSYTDSAASAGATYYYHLVAVDTQQRTSPAATASATTTPAAPPAPTGLQAAVYDSAITLSWVANTGSDLAGYQVFRAASPGGSFVQVSPGITQTAPSFIDTGAPNGTPAYYKVVAVDIYGQASAAATITATRPATPPAAPTGLAAIASVKSITLSWNANSESDLAGYQILRAASTNGPYTQVNSGILTATSFIDTTAPAGVVSYYRVVAVNQLAMVSPPEAISAKRLPAKTPPAIPTGFAASAALTGVTLTWTAATGTAADNVAGYYVYRCYSAHGHYNKLNAKPLPPATLTFLDISVKAKKAYYELVAVSPTGVASKPARISTTRPAPPKAAKASKAGRKK